jgi:serine protease inhibitor
MTQSTAKANNHFTFRLLGLLTDPTLPRNLFLSPYSLHTALSMTLNGAAGDTLQAMKTSLGWGRTSRTTINQDQANLRQALEQNQDKIILGTANSVWVDQKLGLMEEFERRCREYYAARAERVDFEDPATRKQINSWIAEKTHDRITDLLKPEHLAPPPIAALVNAIYFKGLWQQPFKPEQTREAPFIRADGSQKSINLMQGSMTCSYFEGQDFQIAGLAYGEGEFSLEICLPARSQPLPDFIARLDERTWKDWMGRQENTEIEIGLPRFSLKFEAEMGPALARVGMGIAFSEKANFSNLCTGSARISNVLHAAFLEVNEEGSQAAAATVVVMKRMSMLPKPKPRLIVDRPFFCVIRHRPSGIILFAGGIYDP